MSDATLDIPLPLAGSNVDLAVLVSALVARSPYRSALTPLLHDITRIALANVQLRAALADIALRSDFSRTNTLRRCDLGAAAAPITAFLEQVYFSSPGFLKSVGEWPVGGARG
ncbi:hypothetical protein GCM10007301_38850 [Azorhizobium oxalatiphilum]|uniref:Uncharacterized protein n=1 Tax=Azorhizobium oxalatiphilum TaxID=980631 RepID=A0A917C9I0_9HYPH|nr:hypothetical protein [Azorhizobium oxalatiphilum]GGF75215.1 hypothetical protein GCM10007301_38850 [Azorhizobium oxalatiphilum]